MKKYLKFIPLFIVVILILIQTAALINCEILTNKYYPEFEYVHQSNAMIGEIEYFKVISYNDEAAKVYYVCKDKSCSIISTYKKIDDSWVEIEWSTVWSKTGSASNVIWPYWWHFIYAGF